MKLLLKSTWLLLLLPLVLAAGEADRRGVVAGLRSVGNPDGERMATLVERALVREPGDPA